MCEVQAVVDCQRDIIGNQEQKADFVPGEGVSGLSRKTKSPQSTECRIQRKHTKGLVSAFTEELNRLMEAGLLIERGDDESMRLLRDHLTDIVLPWFAWCFWKDCKPLAVSYI